MNNDSQLNSIEWINARKIVSGIPTNWNLILLNQDIKPRNEALVAQIDDNEIVILGGDGARGEVLLFNTSSNFV